jgi:DNA-binding response OmpR family regulator
VSQVVLIVEDELKIRELVRRYLERAGLAVLTTGSGAEAITMAADARPDLVVLDLGLPDVPGEEVARELRVGSDVPILMLTARSDERDRIAGLELGADDYVTKPFSPRELTLRVLAVLRRHGPVDGRTGPRSFGGGVLRIDEDRHVATVRGGEIELTPTEWGLLTALARAPGRVYSRYELINRVRGYEFEGYERTIDSHVKNLRRKIEADAQRPEIVQTVLGVGYRLGLRADG